MFLPERSVGRVWGGGKGEGNVPSVRASIQPDTTVGTVRFCTLYTKVFCRSNSCFCPFYILVWYILWSKYMTNFSDFDTDCEDEITFLVASILHSDEFDEICSFNQLISNKKGEDDPKV